MSEIIINDLFVELKEENNRLLNELLLTQKCVHLLEKYRNCLISFSNNCKCHQNINNKNIINLLENEYKSVFNNNEKQSENNIKSSENVKKNKRKYVRKVLKKSKTLDNCKRDINFSNFKTKNQFIYNTIDDNIEDKEKHVFE